MQVLTYYERQQIEYFLKLKMTRRQIGQRLKRDHTVISRELKRHIPKGMRYSAQLAQKAADRKAKQTNTRKLEKDGDLKYYVISQLKVGWSPQQIAGVLKSQPPPGLRGVSVSHESIYQYIYSGEGRYEYLYPLLPQQKPKRQQRYTRRHKKLSIPERISIHLRPLEIDQKQRVGDWESDSVQFKKQKEGLSVQYERKTMLMRMHKILDRSAQETQAALTHSIESLPTAVWRSITFDNGKEGTCHINIKQDWDIQTYFCDPYSSWQKGGVENMNGLVRRYLPRETNLGQVTDQDIEQIQEKLNNRPRKSLNYLTPNQVMSQYLKQVVH